MNFRMAVNCHICGKSLIKEEFMDSLPVWDKEEGEEGKLTYWGQGHRSCFWKAQNKKKYWEKRLKEDRENSSEQRLTKEEREEAEKEEKRKEQRLKRLTKEELEEAGKQENCKYCGKPLLQKNFRDAVKDHCHITGKFRGAAHSDCKKKLRINHKSCTIPVVFHNLQGYDGHHLMQYFGEP
jgi:hypothetical protein